MNTTRMFAVSVAVATICATAVGQGKDDFMRQQAYAEMQRVSGQVDVLQNNLGDLQDRVSKLEGGGDAKGLRQEIDALKAELASLRRELQSQRGEIVKDLSGRLKDIQKSMTPPSPPPQPQRPAKPAYTGPCKEYVVEGGDTLSLIASAFSTTVSKLKEMNNLKSDNLRIGQKLLVPAK